jgi:hypothetical protein
VSQHDSTWWERVTYAPGSDRLRLGVSIGKDGEVSTAKRSETIRAVKHRTVRNLGGLDLGGWQPRRVAEREDERMRVGLED